MTAITNFFSFWRTTTTRDREIVDAVVRPEHAGPSLALRAALDQWNGVHYWVSNDGAPRLVLVRVLAPPRRERWWLHAFLFVSTFLTVWMGGGLLAGAPYVLPPLHSVADAWGALAGWVQAMRPGLEFAMGLMAILLAHEAGHYIAARRYGIDVSPPYFLPAPPLWNFVGTFGAFIRLRSPVVDRRQLLDVGAAGPWAGFAVAVLVLFAGLSLSETVSGVGAQSPQLIMLHDQRLYLGDSLFMAATRRLFTDGGTMVLHPLAFAGWLGLLVTALNLLPLGQLDGGHVLYGLVGGGQRWLGRATWLALLALGSLFWGWILWAALTLLLGRGRLAHPSVLERHRPVPGSRQPFGWATVLLFVVTFTPVPFHGAGLGALQLF
ncbi:MAG TPA: site-2 protease family protein [Gemmatimonadales bacterium]|nr:site-2 protease family protein [Gemmatimonadales bacterium]